MNEMYGYPTFFDGIIFVETDINEGKRISLIKADLSFKFGAHLKNLNDVKKDLANKAKFLNCNCVSNFKYGQKSRWLAIDDVAYFGNGIATKIDSNLYDEILNYIKKRSE